MRIAVFGAGGVGAYFGGRLARAGHSVAFVARGSANIGLGRFADAASDYKRANLIAPMLSSPIYGLAEAYRALGRPSDARRFYQRYLGPRSAGAGTYGAPSSIRR